MARGMAQQIGKLFKRRHDASDIGRHRDDIVRIIGLLRLQRGLHWCSLLSPMSPARSCRRIYADVEDVMPQTSLRFDQSKAVRWRVLGRLWAPAFGNSGAPAAGSAMNKVAGSQQGMGSKPSRIQADDRETHRYHPANSAPIKPI